jgi:hypothetical protein
MVNIIVTDRASLYSKFGGLRGRTLKQFPVQDRSRSSYLPSSAFSLFFLSLRPLRDFFGMAIIDSVAEPIGLLVFAVSL